MNSLIALLRSLIRKKKLWAMVILILILVAFYSDIIFEGRTFLMETAAAGTMPGAGPYKYEGTRPGFVANDPGAIALYGEPLNKFISTAIKNGTMPLWNPYAGLVGAPLLADGQTGLFEPLQLLFFFVPDRFWPLSMDVQLIIRFFLAGFGCYLFARRQRLDFWGSISAAILFMLSSYFVTYGNHPQVKTETLLPLVVYGYDRLVDPKDRVGFWLCALVIAWAVIAAMPEATFFSLFLGTLWYFYKSLTHQQKNDFSFQGGRNLFWRYAGSTGIGLSISAAYLLPFLEFVSFAKSSHLPGTGSSPYALRFLPGLLFQLRNKFFLHLGFFSLFSLIFSVLNLKNWSKYQQHIIFFGLYAAISITALFDVPATNWIRDLPVFNQLDVGKYPLPSINFCLAILTGILIDRAKQGSFSYKKLSLTLLLFSIVFIGVPGVTSFKSLSDYSSDLNFIMIAIRVIISISILLYLLALYQRSRLFNPTLVRVVILIIVVLEPFLGRSRINRPDRFDPFQAPPFIGFLNNEENVRVFGLDGTLYPNISTAYRLADIRWLSALIPQRTYNFSSQFIESKEVNSIRLTGTSLPLSDSMFDLLNVKYILKQNSQIRISENCQLNIDDQPYFGRATINQSIFEQNQDKKNFYPELPLNINGATRMALFAQPPQAVVVDFLVPKQASELDFSIGLSPEVFLPEYGDGVTFKIILLGQENRMEVFSKYIDPKNNPCDRKWFDERISLEKWAGKEVTLRFTTTGGPNKDTTYDWAYWGDIRFAPPSNPTTVSTEITKAPYNLVYQDEDVLIYQNRDVYPRAFVVHDLINVSSFNEALSLVANPEIDLRHTAIVENLPADYIALLEKGDKSTSSGSATISRVTPNSLEIETKTNSPGLFVLSEQYYPGWHAYVDGNETRIYAVDGILRGVFLEEGSHTVLFEYRPLSFLIGLVVTLIALSGTIVSLVYFYRHSNHIES